MRETEPMTHTMNVSDARKSWSKLVNAVFRRQQRVVIEKAGIPVAALVSPQDLERLRRYDAQRADDFKILDRIGAAFADVPSDELEREVAKAIAEVRAERRAASQPVSSPP